MTNTDTTTNTNSAAQRSHAGRVAVVTGATSGIGEATALLLGAAGAAVALVGRRTDRLEAIAATINDAGGRALPITADLADAGAAARVADAVHAELGPVDLVVANAGVMLPAPYESLDHTELGRMLDLNIRGLIETGNAFAADLLAAGADGRPADLVHVGSIGSHVIYPTYAGYAATKAGVAQITRTVRAEWGPRGVRVHTVEPGPTNSELADHISSDEARTTIERYRDDAGAIDSADIASVIGYATGLPANVNVTELVVVPTGI
jgi:NADP-dependent 3-hydroxy acid dehydrogenase YdfG